MSNILSKASLVKIENVRKYALKAAVWLLVGSVVLGAIIISFGSISRGSEIIRKFMGTMLIVALTMIVGMNNFKMVASKDKEVKVFALIGLVSSLAWALLWIILCWMPEWVETCAPIGGGGLGGGWHCDMSILLKFAAIFSYLSVFGLIVSNVLAIYEGNRRSLIRPLKITAVVCIAYDFLFLMVMAFLGFDLTFFDFDLAFFGADFASDIIERLGVLAVFAGFVWFVIVIVVLLLSKNEKNRVEYKDVELQPQEVAKGKKKKVKTIQRKTDEELRAEIEEQVRREMIEKEVRARLEAEKAATNNSKAPVDNSQTENAEKIVEDSFEVKE